MATEFNPKRISQNILKCLELLLKQQYGNDTLRMLSKNNFCDKVNNTLEHQWSNDNWVGCGGFRVSRFALLTAEQKSYLSNYQLLWENEKHSLWKWILFIHSHFFIESAPDIFDF